jgi:hypothetical protein
VRRRISHQAIGSLIRTSSQPATRTTSCTLATLSKTKRSEASLSPSPAQGMHTCIRMHTICHLSLATSNQSVALISNHHMSESFERYLSACTPKAQVKVTCLPARQSAQILTSPVRRRLPLTRPVISSSQPSPMQPAANRLLPSPTIRPRSPSTPAVPAIPPTPPIAAAAAVARPHVHHVGNPEATTVLYAVVRCRVKATNGQRRLEAVWERAVTRRCGKDCRPQHCSRVVVGGLPNTRASTARLLRVWHPLLLVRLSHSPFV